METVDFTQGILPQFIDGAQMNLPLFFQGTDFTNTTIENAMVQLGYTLSDKGAPLPRGAWPKDI